MGYEDQHAEEEGFDEDGAVVLGDPMVAMSASAAACSSMPATPTCSPTSYATYYVGYEALSALPRLGLPPPRPVGVVGRFDPYYCAAACSTSA